MRKKRKADLDHAKVAEYRSMEGNAYSAQGLADFFHRRRRKLLDEFAMELGFDNRKDAKRQGYSLQIYMSELLIVAHPSKTTDTVLLFDPNHKHYHVVLANYTDVDVFISGSFKTRPRDGGSMKLESGSSIQFPYQAEALYMAADCAEPVVFFVNKEGSSVTISIGEKSKPENRE